MANAERKLMSITDGYGPSVRDSDIEYLQWKLDYAAGMRIAIKRFIDSLERDNVSLGKRSYSKLQDLIMASDLFQNYTPR